METVQTALLQAGVAGAVLAWFMWRAEKIWREMIDAQRDTETAVNRLARAQLMLTIASDNTPRSVKRLAADLDKELDDSEVSRSPSRAGRSGPRG